MSRLTNSLTHKLTTALRHRIVAVPAPGVAAANALYAQPATANGPVFAYGLNGILRTGGGVSAGVRQVRRQDRLINAHQPNQYGLHHERITPEQLKTFPQFLSLSAVVRYQPALTTNRYVAIRYLGR